MISGESLTAGGDVAAGAFGLLEGVEFREGGVGVGVVRGIAAQTAVGDAAAASFCDIPRKVSPAFAGRSHCNWV